MQKILTIVHREYVAAVRSKLFLISLILMPLMMLSGVISQRLSRSISDTNTYKIAVVDRTPGQGMLQDLIAAAAKRNATSITGPDGKQNAPRYEIVGIDPVDASDKAAVDRQRLELSDRLRSQEFTVVLEIGANVTTKISAGSIATSVASAAIKPGGLLGQFLPGIAPATQPATQARPESPPSDTDNDLMTMASSMASAPDENIVRYTTNRPTLAGIRPWLQNQLLRSAVGDALASAGSTAASFNLPMLIDRGMARTTPTGGVTYEENSAGVITNFIVPVVLFLLMLVITIVGTSPLTTNVIEEKSQHIAEVLLGSVTPFQLMMGKLLGGVGVSLTLGLIYTVGILVAAYQFQVIEYAKPALVGWFIVMTILSTLLFGACFTAAGAAVTNLKESQAIIAPVMLLLTAPFFFFNVIIEFPNGLLARTLTYIPFFTPSVAMLRLSIPPSMPLWEILLAVVWCLLSVAGIVWVAGRIFRVGMLMNTKPANLSELLRWITRG
jgi:ABC-2 type transport system permease protein